MQYKLFRLFFVLTLVIELAMVSAPQSAHAVGPWYVSNTGNDSNDCMSPGAPCATINGAIGKASAGDTINVAVGTYTGTGSEVVLINKDTTLSGGWDSTFSTQNGASVIDGEFTRRGVTVSASITAYMEYFVVQNGDSINGNNGVNNDGNLTLEKVTIQNNGTNPGSGNNSGINNSVTGVLTLSNSAVINNGTVNNCFGGIWNQGNLAAINSTISGNVSNTIYCYGAALIGYGTVSLRNSTIVNNTGNTDMMGAFGTFTLKNSLIGSCGNSTSMTSQGYNMISSNDCPITPATADQFGTPSAPIDLLIGTLQNNGGPTFTHALLSLSLAIDAGDPAGCTNQNGNPLTTDQRGSVRPQGTRCDIGAYEYSDITTGPATSLSVLSGGGQSTALNFAFPQPLKVVALDGQGNRVSGVTVTFTAPTSGASGTFAGSGTNTTMIDTDAGGAATTSIFTANDQAGTYTVSVSAPGLQSVDFNMNQAFHPANDNFSNAESVSPPLNAMPDVTDATNEPGEPQNCSYMPNTVWYSFRPTETMWVRADTAGSAINTNLNIYHDTGFGISGLSLLSNGCTIYYGPIAFLAEAGQTYYLQAGGVYGEVGTVKVNLSLIPPPPNDNFADASPIGSLPSTIDFDAIAATFQSSEPSPTCASSAPPYKTVWFSFTASQNGPLSASVPSSNFSSFVGIYRGAGFNNLTQLGCGQGSNRTTFQAVNGQTYYFQVGGFYGEGGTGQFLLENAPLPQASFYYYPGDPSKYDTIQFQDNSYDPGNIGIQTHTWNFGDGTSASSSSPTHKYATDGDYQVTHTVTTIDSRTASVTQTVQVRTHDVAITKITVPASANVGQTKTISVTLRNIAYPETVQIDLYKSTPNGFVWIATVTKSVPALKSNRTTAVDFSYKFLSEDAKLGKVTFKAVVTINGARDAYPSDNEEISSITKVAK